MSQDRIAVLNGARGLAICAVIYHHVFARFTPPGTGALEVGGWLLLPLAPLSNGWMGVNLFFVLSGFVLALPFERRTRVLASRADISGFYLRRAARLLPLYYVVSLLSYIFSSPPNSQTPINFVMMLTATFNFSQETYFPAYNLVLWSLGIEIWMSLFFPMLLVVRQRFGPWSFFVATTVLATSVRVFGNQPQFVNGNLLVNWVKDSLFGRLDDFALGMVLAAVFVSWGDRRVSRTTKAMAIGFAGAALFVTCQAWDLIRLGRLDPSVAPFLNNLFHLVCVTGLLALLFSSSGALRFLFTNRPIQLCGMMCYSLYVWHGVLIPPAGLTAQGGYNAQNLVIFFVWLLLLAALSYRYIEFGHVRETRSLFQPRAR